MVKWVRNNTLTTIALVALVVTNAIVVVQARTIETQRNLIRQLFTDSQELSARKMKDVKIKGSK